MIAIKDIVTKTDLTREDIITLLSSTSAEDIAVIREAAERMVLMHCSDVVFWRGLIEFSNACAMDCHYCGIRRSNNSVKRYMLTADQILESAKWCASQGYGSVVLQSGERQDSEFIKFVEEVVKRIKVETVSKALPQGLGITLCVGEQSREAYQRFFAVGAHRYLLRIESTNPDLFAAIHPPAQKLHARAECLKTLRDIGYQVGTGVLIGLPGQTIEMLADDILFFKAQDIDMIGMGPYIPHPATPLGAGLSNEPAALQKALNLSLLMIATTRLTLKDVNIAATTALQAISETGREEGLRFGANVLMPQLTPTEHRKDYLLYPGKPCITETAGDCAACLAGRVRSTGRRLVLNDWGDSPHFARKKLKEKIP